MILAAFDFDGTITDKDSFHQFLKFAVSKPAYLRGALLLSPVLLAYLFGRLHNHVAKQKVFAHFFGAWSSRQFADLAERFSTSELAMIVRPDALSRMAWHQVQGHTVVVVSASMDAWLKPWCDSQRIDLICTEVEQEGGQLTGAFRTPNCYGPEKVKRLKSHYASSEIDYMYAYGDSRGDKELLEMADEKFYRWF